MLLWRKVIIIFLSTILIFPFACSLSNTSNPANPSYRMLTTQVLEIDSALSTRGGLASLVQSRPTSTSSSSGMGMSGGTSTSTTSATELNWKLISSRVSIIEKNWEDIRLELERRSIESGPTWYLKYYRIMAVRESFEMSLAAIKLDISNKQKERIVKSVSMINDAFAEVKKELNIPVVDSERLGIVLGGSITALIILTFLTSFIAHHKDRKLIKAVKSAD